MKKIILTAACLGALALPAAADPTIGVGMTIAFGGSGGPQTGIGARIFSDDEEGDTVGTIGLDYMFQSGSWRPSIGAAYIDNDLYIGADIGFGLGNGGGINFGVSGGYVNTKAPPATAIGQTEEEMYYRTNLE
ncbi:hypothetical protein SAMN05877809_102280 [Rhodobacter sp. JA431]|uniref:hypothetical protein n=1 Tax=Rhodobacter sp. JA431 TaxID=570013 RepID=UPI000BC81662|nr:hypothetical protein [Rhodobacter sp. JA431]SOB98551.1 hypothetical protein SAMN05877809_102280 [Rhodobacter sp. JA431]